MVLLLFKSTVKIGDNGNSFKRLRENILESFPGRSPRVFRIHRRYADFNQVGLRLSAGATYYNKDNMDKYPP